MPSHLRRCRGYSLIELLVVLVIVGILAVVGVIMIGNRPAGSVRAVLDELEGVLASAQKRAVATGQDVVISTSGDWGVPNILTMTYTGATGGDGFTLAHRDSGGVAVALLREHLHGGVVTVDNAAWWDAARGTSTDLSAVAPFNNTVLDSAAAAFQGAKTPVVPATVPPTYEAGPSILANSNLNLFKGSTAGVVAAARISGTSKRFTTTFWIEVVGLRNGVPIPGGPMGALVVLANGATIYKFYSPETSGGVRTWRRL